MGNLLRPAPQEHSESDGLGVPRYFSDLPLDSRDSPEISNQVAEGIKTEFWKPRSPSAVPVGPGSSRPRSRFHSCPVSAAGPEAAAPALLRLPLNGNGDASAPLAPFAREQNLGWIKAQPGRSA